MQLKSIPDQPVEPFNPLERGLYDDLIKHFNIEKVAVKEQINAIDPFAVTLNKSRISRVLNTGFHMFLEILSYLMAIFSLVMIYFQDKLYPFYMLSKFTQNSDVKANFSETDIQNYSLVINGLFVVIALLFVVIGRQISKNRRKNKVIFEASNVVKQVAGDLLNRQSRIDDIQRKHIYVLPMNDHFEDSIESIKKDVKMIDDIILE